MLLNLRPQMFSACLRSSMRWAGKANNSTRHQCEDGFTNLGITKSANETARTAMGKTAMMSRSIYIVRTECLSQQHAKTPSQPPKKP